MLKPLWALLLTGMLGGCAMNSETPPPITDKEWTVSRIDDQRPAAGSQLSLNFGSDGQLSGSAGCNRYMARYQILGNNEIRISQAATTMMACPEELMRQEQHFLDALEHMNRLRIAPQGKLILTGEQHRILAH